MNLSLFINEYKFIKKKLTSSLIYELIRSHIHNILNELIEV